MRRGRQRNCVYHKGRGTGYHNTIEVQRTETVGALYTDFRSCGKNALQPLLCLKEDGFRRRKNGKMAEHIILCGYLGICSCYDCRYRRIPLWLLRLGIGIGGLYAAVLLFSGQIAWQAALTGAAPGAVMLLYSRLSQKKLGWADGLMVIPAGLMQQWERCTAEVLLACFLTFLVALILLLSGKGKQKYKNSFCAVFSRCRAAFGDNGYRALERRKRMRGRLDRKTIKNTGYLLNAYMTLEACFIVPIAVILTAFLLILTFYLYTVCFLNQAAYIAAFRASLTEGAGYVREEKAGEELEKLLSEALIRLPEMQQEITATSSGVTVEVTAEWALPGLSILPADVGILRIEAEKEALIRDAPAFIPGHEEAFRNRGERLTAAGKEEYMKKPLYKRERVTAIWLWRIFRRSYQATTSIG